MISRLNILSDEDPDQDPDSRRFEKPNLYTVARKGPIGFDNSTKNSSYLQSALFMNHEWFIYFLQLMVFIPAPH